MLTLFDGTLGAQETLRFVEEKLHAGIWSWDLATGDMEWSHGFYALLGVEQDSIRPSSAILSQMVHPEDRLPSEAVGLALHEGLPAEWEFRIIRPNGRIRWISTRSELLMDSEGHPVRSIGVSFDVTKRHEVLQSLDIASGHQEALIKAAQGIVWFADKNGQITRLLRSGETALERPAGRQSEPWTELVHPDEKNSIGLAPGGCFKGTPSIRTSHSPARWHLSLGAHRHCPGIQPPGRSAGIDRSIHRHRQREAVFSRHDETEATHRRPNTGGARHARIVGQESCYKGRHFPNDHSPL